MRIVYYAIGGGLGHLVRARAFLHTMKQSGDAAVLTASEYARDRRVVGDLPILFAPRELDHHAVEFGAWLQGELGRLRPDVLCTDAFPAGILGELCDFPGTGVELWHVARRLRWDAYRAQLAGECPRYRRAFRVETLGAAHETFLQAHADSIEDLELVDPPGDLSAAAPRDCVEPYWLVVHSGPAPEVAELTAYADEVRRTERAAASLLVISANAPSELPPRTRVLDAFPATPYFAAAQRIFSAAGFNVMRQTAQWRAKHWVLPLERRFDDQFARSKLAIPAARGASVANQCE